MNSDSMPAEAVSEGVTLHGRTKPCDILRAYVLAAPLRPGPPVWTSSLPLLGSTATVFVCFSPFSSWWYLIYLGKPTLDTLSSRKLSLTSFPEKVKTPFICFTSVPCVCLWQQAAHAIDKLPFDCLPAQTRRPSKAGPVRCPLACSGTYHTTRTWQTLYKSTPTLGSHLTDT